MAGHGDHPVRCGTFEYMIAMKHSLIAKYRKDEKRLDKILAACDASQPPLQAARALLYALLQPDQYAMRYRYEHCLRACGWAEKIARGENWDPEPLMLAALLHDAGYPFCKTMEEWPAHAAVSAHIAERFLSVIHYPPSLSSVICRGIAIHDIWMDVPKDATAFELSVRDADDLDRFDALRLCLISHGHIREKGAAEALQICTQRLQTLDAWAMRPCGTKTAETLWQNTLSMHRETYLRLQQQMQRTLDMENTLFPQKEGDAPCCD